ncbi:M56 family metallopeptidase [Paenibacillus sp. FSL W8-0194]|uniref:M56 family metallopeptidase n=1 Tax=Paenibacillus sp. FSL W8-0194 TaxID=2921711 RepID=UPI0030D7B5BD
MTSLFSDYLNISVTTSLLIVILLFLTPLLRKHYSAKWTYWIWMVLAIRLLLPFHFSFDKSLIDIPLPSNPIMNPTAQGMSQVNTQVENPLAAQPIQVQTAVEPAVHAPSLFYILATIWLIGAVLFFAYHVAGYYTFRKQALRWSRPIESKLIAARIRNMMLEMGVPLSIPVLTSEKVPNPMLVGFRKPLLLLPHEQYSEEELTFIIKHELVHYQRHDILYKLLLVTVHALHWFNPFVWLLVREASREIELYCDDTVVFKQSLAYRKKYCEVILSVMQKPSPRFLALSTNFLGGKHTMKQRFKSILSMKKKRSGLMLFCAVVLSLGVLAACANVTSGNSAAFKPGTIYSNLVGDQVVSYDAGNSYSIDKEGHVSISYRNGKVTAKTPLQLDMARESFDRGLSEGSFFISEDKTAIVYNPDPDKFAPVHVLISDNMGKTWNETVVQNEDAKGDELFIGFTSEKEGWMVVGHGCGVACAENFVFQTSDGGKTWIETGNPNDQYSEHLTGVGFSNPDTGFLGYRYFTAPDPIIYWTKDRGKTWDRLPVSLPEKFENYSKNPLSPFFNGKEGRFPISLSGDNGIIGTIYLSSKDGGLTWAYDASLDKLK